MNFSLCFQKSRIWTSLENHGLIKKKKGGGSSFSIYSLSSSKVLFRRIRCFGFHNPVMCILAFYGMKQFVLGLGKLEFYCISKQQSDFIMVWLHAYLHVCKKSKHVSPGKYRFTYMLSSCLARIRRSQILANTNHVSLQQDIFKASQRRNTVLRKMRRKTCLSEEKCPYFNFGVVLLIVVFINSLLYILLHWIFLPEWEAGFLRRYNLVGCFCVCFCSRKTTEMRASLVNSVLPQSSGWRDINGRLAGKSQLS